MLLSLGRISLNFDDADVFSVIQTVFGEILKVNYIVDQRVKGRVTFRSIAPIPVDQVLPVMETILRINGVGVVEEGGLYRVVPIADVAKEPAQIKFGREPEKVLIQGKSIIQVVPLQHVQSSETIKLLTPFLTQTAVVIDLPNINHIVIVDTDSNVKRIYGNKLLGNLLVSGIDAWLIDFPAGEESKNADLVNVLHTQLLEHGVRRDSLIIALGGGVVGDVAGYVAATLLRGIK